MAKVPGIALALGSALLIAAAASLDYRLGLAVAGVVCVAFGLLFDGDA